MQKPNFPQTLTQYKYYSKHLNTYKNKVKSTVSMCSDFFLNTSQHMFTSYKYIDKNYIQFKRLESYDTYNDEKNQKIDSDKRLYYKDYLISYYLNFLHYVLYKARKSRLKKTTDQLNITMNLTTGQKIFDTIYIDMKSLSTQLLQKRVQIHIYNTKNLNIHNILPTSIPDYYKQLLLRGENIHSQTRVYLLAKSQKPPTNQYKTQKFFVYYVSHQVHLQSREIF
eukprot:TRINITY_DN5405_c0_g1_i2.p2 TRINITY_DN5405_c0_g1~~TRINITY_DN5405_c0_g1_i2.p2  ORF type:complete len:224 (+),score=-16.79 TRINITY_DN5405_c0_g1_i2:800-1471(+)